MGNGAVVARIRVDDFGVRDVPTPVELGGFPEDDDVFVLLLENFFNPIDTVEPHQFNGARSIGELRRQPAVSLLSKYLIPNDIPSELHEVAFR